MLSGEIGALQSSGCVRPERMGEEAEQAREREFSLTTKRQLEKRGVI